MATTRDYVSFLNGEVDIAPANTQEELQAAEAIERLMGQHDVDVRMQEFDAPAWGGLPYRVLMIVMFVGVFLAGMQGSVACIVGIVLTCACLALFVARYLGYDLVGGIGPQARSQNVIAIHRASGPLADKANRPIVVVAHYDTPRDNFLHSAQLAFARPLIGRFSPYLVLTGGVCGVFQALVFVPDAARIVVWILGIVAALPLAVLGVSSIAERLAPCTDGANDNKSGVAALMGALATVSPAVDGADGMAGGDGDVASDVASEVVNEAIRDPAIATPTVVRRYEEVVGVRHGKDLLEDLHILPENCTIVYREPRVVSEIAADPIGVIGPDTALHANGDEYIEDEGILGATGDLVARGASVVADVTQRGRELFGRLSSRLARGRDEGDLDSYAQDDANAYGDGSQDAVNDVPTAGAANADAQAWADEEPAGVTNDMTVAEGITFSQEGNPSDSEITGRDDSGLAVMGDVYDRQAEQAEPPRPPQPTDGNWGQSDLGPSTTGGFARRAVLFDLPDPSSNSSDPFATGSTSEGDATPTAPSASEAGAFDISTPSAPAPVSLVGDIAVLGSDDEWKGGAAPRGGLRSGADDAHEDLRDAMRESVLGMNDDALIAHDIWFVALGASALDHAGMRAFVDQYRRDVRGAFVINLSCVGAGALTMLTSEGVDNARRADRRLTRLVAKVADDLHIDLGHQRYDWDTTDATVAMRRSMRAVTLVGLDETGVPALSRTADDVIDNVDPSSVTRTAELVCEVIRRA